MPNTPAVPGPPAAGPSAIAPLAMTLCGMAYAFPEDIERHLANASLTEGWVPTWVPGERKGYFAFAAACEPAKRFAVAVRGTNPSFTTGFVKNLISNVNVWKASEWEHGSGGGARIAAGAREGLSVLSTIRDKRGETLLEHLTRTVPEGATVLVTGHSLGGCLASVLAMDLRRANGGRFEVHPITFAAPTAGNQRFAELYQAAFPDAERYFNRMDLVPRAWHDLVQFRDLYDPPAPKCPRGFGKLAGFTAQRVARFGYTHPGEGTVLPDRAGSPRPDRGPLAALVTTLLRRKFLIEALYQHVPNTYLANLDAPPLPFRLPLPWLRRNLRRLSRLVGRK